MKISSYDEFLRLLPVLRGQAGFSQKQLAEKLGVTQAMYSMMEQGKRQFSAEQVFLVQALLCENSRATDANLGVDSELAELYASMSLEQRRFLTYFAKGLLRMDNKPGRKRKDS